MNSAVSSLLKKMCYQLNCGYNLITLKVYKYICIFMHFFDKIVYISFTMSVQILQNLSESINFCVYQNTY